MAAVFTSCCVINSLNARISIVKCELFVIIKYIIVFSIVLAVVSSACYIKLLNNSEYGLPTMALFSASNLRHTHCACMHDNPLERLNTKLKCKHLFRLLGCFLSGLTNLVKALDRYDSGYSSGWASVILFFITGLGPGKLATSL